MMVLPQIEQTCSSSTPLIVEISPYYSGIDVDCQQFQLAFKATDYLA